MLSYIVMLLTVPCPGWGGFYDPTFKKTAVRGVKREIFLGGLSVIPLRSGARTSTDLTQLTMGVSGSADPL